MRKKKMIFITTIISILFFAFSILFIAEKSSHDCHGEDCKICEKIAIFEKDLKEFGADAIATITVVFFKPFPKALNEKIKVCNCKKKDSLILLKIKLLD